MLPHIDFFTLRTNGKTGVQVNYDFLKTRQDYGLMAGPDNTLNPLVTIYRNSRLKSAATNTASIQLSTNRSKYNQTADFLVWWRAIHGQTSYARHYDATTGAYEYMPGNVNGNWRGYVSSNYETDLDAHGRFHASGMTYYDFIHSVDFDITASELSMDLSKVDNHTVGQSLSLSYKTGKFSAKLNGVIAWHKIDGKDEGFDDFHYTDFHYGITINSPLVWKMSLATDMTMYSRQGYSTADMNTDDLVWNASLSRPFAKDHLLVKLSAVDILHELSNRKVSVNAQGRTETWVNSIPNYLMVSVQYKFKI